MAVLTVNGVKREIDVAVGEIVRRDERSFIDLRLVDCARRGWDERVDHSSGSCELENTI